MRFIPACAGNTKVAPNMPCASAVHPRVRGEHTDCNLLVYQFISKLHISTKKIRIVKEHFLRPEEGRKQDARLPYQPEYAD